MFRQCSSCVYGGLVCGRGLVVDYPNYRSCIGFTPGRSLGRAAGMYRGEYLRIIAKNMLDQAPKFSFEIEEYKVLCRRWTQFLWTGKKEKLIMYSYFIRLRNNSNSFALKKS